MSSSHLSRHPRERGDPAFMPSSSRTRGSSFYAVILADAGIQLLSRHPRERGDPAFMPSSSRTRGSSFWYLGFIFTAKKMITWIPACAGMTEVASSLLLPLSVSEAFRERTTAWMQEIE